MSDYNVGLNLIETNGTATVPLVGASTSTAGFMVITERGPVNKPILVNSWVEYQNTFGNPVTKTDGNPEVGAYAVKGFFENGGRQAYICRVGDETKAQSASASTEDDSKEVKIFFDEFKSLWNTLNTELPKLNIDISNINKITDTIAQTKTQIATLNNQIKELQDLSKLSIDTFKNNKEDYIKKNANLKDTEETLKTDQIDLETEIGNLKKWLNEKKFIKNSYTFFNVVRELYTRSQSQQIASLKKLNFKDGSLDKETLLQEIITVSASAYSILFGGEYSGVDKNLKDLSEKDPKKIDSNLANLQKEIATLNTKINSEQLDTPAVTTSQTQKKISITAGYQGGDNQGVWGNRLAVSVKQDGTKGKEPTDSLYTLTVGLFKDEESKKKYEDEQDKEKKKKLNPPTLEVYNNMLPEELYEKIKTSSKLIKCSDIKTFKNDLKTITTEEISLFSDGLNPDTLSTLTIEELKNLLDDSPIQMLAYPDVADAFSETVIKAGIAYCANRNDCVFIASPKELRDIDANAIKNTEFPGNLKAWDRGNSYGVLYAPWIKVYGTNKLIEVPPTGHIMGVYARISAERGIWKAPAGDEAGLRGVIGVTQQYTDAQHTKMVRDYHINCIRYIPASGIVIDSSRTLCSDPRWWYVNVRRLFNFVKSSLKDGLRWVRQEPNRSDLWNKVKFNVVRPFMMDLWRQGAFGTGTPEQVFTIKCDADNNPPHHVDQGIFKLEVYLYPSKPAETILITVGQQDFGGSASEN